MKHYFIEINDNDLLRYFAHLCWPCSNDMYSRNVNVLMKNVVDKNRFNREMEV